MRYGLRTLLSLMAVVPPLLAVGWWLYGERWQFRFFATVILIALIPEVLFATFGYGFGALCYVIGWLPGGKDRKDSH